MYELIKKDKDVVYDSKINNYTIDTINAIVLPFDGIDMDGYIKGCDFKLEKILELKTVKTIYCGKANYLLKSLCDKYKINLIVFTNNDLFNNNNFLLALNVVEFFLMEKLNLAMDDVNLLVTGSKHNAYIAAKKFICNIFDSEKDLSKYDAVIIFDSCEIDKTKKVVIDMREIEEVDLLDFIDFKENYHIDYLMRHYLTKSSAKLMYDCMVKN